jgi:hypothetical protein
MPLHNRRKKEPADLNLTNGSRIGVTPFPNRCSQGAAVDAGLQ